MRGRIVGLTLPLAGLVPIRVTIRVAILIARRVARRGQVAASITFPRDGCIVLGSNVLRETHHAAALKVSFCF